MTATKTRRRSTETSSEDAMIKLSNKVQPAAAPEPETAPAPKTRPEVVARLRELGYTGPVSYTMPVLNGVLGWVEAGTPKDGPVPAGALNAVHPLPKAEKPARKPSATYLRALADVRRVLAENGDLDAFLTERGA